jgi:hypothetical protein
MPEIDPFHTTRDIGPGSKEGQPSVLSHVPLIPSSLPRGTYAEGGGVPIHPVSLTASAPVHAGLSELPSNSPRSFRDLALRVGANHTRFRFYWESFSEAGPATRPGPDPYSESITSPTCASIATPFTSILTYSGPDPYSEPATPLTCPWVKPPLTSLLAHSAPNPHPESAVSPHLPLSPTAYHSCTKPSRALFGQMMDLLQTLIKSLTEDRSRTGGFSSVIGEISHILRHILYRLWRSVPMAEQLGGICGYPHGEVGLSQRVPTNTSIPLYCFNSC